MKKYIFDLQLFAGGHNVSVVADGGMSAASASSTSDVQKNTTVTLTLTPADTYELRMVGQNVSDISTLQMMPQLRVVDLSVNQVTNLYPLYFSDCRFTITDMNLSYNGLSDITPLSLLTSIENLDLSYNQITSLQPLMMLSTLRSLRLTGNPLSLEDVNLLCMMLPDCEVIF